MFFSSLIYGFFSPRLYYFEAQNIMTFLPPIPYTTTDEADRSQPAATDDIASHTLSPAARLSSSSDQTEESRVHPQVSPTHSRLDRKPIITSKTAPLLGPSTSIQLNSEKHQKRFRWWSATLSKVHDWWFLGVFWTVGISLDFRSHYRCTEPLQCKEAA